MCQNVDFTLVLCLFALNQKLSELKVKKSLLLASTVFGNLVAFYHASSRYHNGISDRWAVLQQWKLESHYIQIQLSNSDWHWSITLRQSKTRKKRCAAGVKTALYNNWVIRLIINTTRTYSEVLLKAESYGKVRCSKDFPGCSQINS